MVIGHGMLAKKFAKFEQDKAIIIFASGVSNSLETADAAFMREQILLEKIIAEYPEKKLVYFSTCSMYDPNSIYTKYVQHKLKMEKIIENSVKKYIIFRASQIVGHATNATLINYLADRIKTAQTIDIWKNSTRNLIDVDDLWMIVCYFLEHRLAENKIIHIANTRFISILTLVESIEKIVQKSAKYNLLDKGAPYQDIPKDIQSYLKELNIVFDEAYYERVLLKYLKN